MKSEAEIRERLEIVKRAKEEAVREHNIDDVMINIRRSSVLKWVLSD